MDRKRIEKRVKDIVKEYIEHFPSNIKVKEVFLFGSYATGHAGPESDLDLLIISSDFRKINFIKRLELLSSFRVSKATRNIPMDIIGYTPEEFEKIDRESLVMKQAKKEGKIIYRRRKGT